MHRKNSQSAKKHEGISSMALARKVYSSNKVLHRKQTITKIIYESINQSEREGNQKKARASSCYDSNKSHIQNRRQPKPKIQNLPAIKNTQSDSTAEDLMERVNKKISNQPEQRNSIKSFLISRIRKNSRVDTTKQQNQATIVNDNNFSNMQTKRKIFQCKIIRSSKIPFALPKKREDKCRFGELMAGTEDISEIKREPLCHQFISPESQQLIDF